MIIYFIFDRWVVCGCRWCRFGFIISWYPLAETNQCKKRGGNYDCSLKFGEFMLIFVLQNWILHWHERSNQNVVLFSETIDVCTQYDGWSDRRTALIMIIVHRTTALYILVSVWARFELLTKLENMYFSPSITFMSWRWASFCLWQRSRSSGNLEDSSQVEYRFSTAWIPTKENSSSENVKEPNTIYHISMEFRLRIPSFI